MTDEQKRQALICSLNKAQEAASVIPKLQKAIWKLTPPFPFLIIIEGIVHGLSKDAKTYCGTSIPSLTSAMLNNHTEIITCQNCLKEGRRILGKRTPAKDL